MANSKAHIPDLRSYAMHQKASEILLRSPERIEEIHQTLKHWSSMQDTQAQGWALKWMEMIDGLSIEDIAMLIIKKGEEMDFFRKSSPFSTLLSEEERLKIIKEFNYE
ncbi:hypothetical protein [Aliikangiella sp. IMCC44359]|uniref:hypothetical protein n=1 Tax=Aliikangiella sp. IMCC44359 TaxID=3459125 RepID=UPI00403AE50E